MIQYIADLDHREVMLQDDAEDTKIGNRSILRSALQKILTYFRDFVM